MEQTSAVMDQIMSGECPPNELGLLLMALRAKGESVDEIAGAAATLRRHMVSIHTSRENLLDTCGTGGDHSGTFNISTAAALVAAAAGAHVAKHGNRSVTSKSGSADVLMALGVNVEADTGRVETCLNQLGIGFCFAPLLHPAMKRVAEVRRQLGVPTIFNLLGPLCNPAGAPFQLLGVGRADIQQRMAQAARRLGTIKAVVVHGEDGLDEVTLSAATRVLEATAAGVREFTWLPEDFGLSRADRSALLVGTPQESADRIRQVFAGERGPSRDIVVLNAAASLWTVGLAVSPISAAERAAAALDSGAAERLLSRLAAVSWGKEPAG